MGRAPEEWDRWLWSGGGTQPLPLGTVAEIDRWLDRLPDKQTKIVADLGCGPGSRLPLLAARFRQVIAVDDAPEAIARLRRRYHNLGIQFRRRDLRDLRPFHGRLDVAIALDSVRGRKISDIDRILQQIRRCLVEGGILFATFRAAPRATSARAMVLDDGGAVAPESFHEVDLQYRLKRAGLRGAAIRRVTDREGEPRLVCRAVRRAEN